VDELDKGKGGLRAILRGGGTLVFGGTDLLQAKWMAASIVLRDPTAKGARYLDVRIPRRPVAGGLPPKIDPNTGERIDPTTGQPVDGGADSTTDPLSAGSPDPNADGSTATTGDPSPGTSDPSADGSNTATDSQDSQLAGPSP
jgi:hypothetical protein